MPQTVTFFSAQNLIFAKYSGQISFTSLSAKVADWIIELDAPIGNRALIDLRALASVDRFESGTDEYLRLQKKLRLKYAPPVKMALLATQPEMFVLARSFEQIAQDQSPTQIEAFREGSDALAFLGITASDIDAYFLSLGEGLTLT